MHASFSHKRARQAGNVFLTIFALLAAAGIIGGTTISILRGPVASSAQLSKAKIADTAMQAAARLIGAPDGPTTDCDGDGTIEPVAWEDPAGRPTVAGGGILPSSLGAAKTDPWGSAYAYCLWDYGTQTVTDNVPGCGGSGANRLVGGTSRTEPVIAIISAGPDKRFETACNAFTDANSDGLPDLPLVAKVAGSDDRIHIETLDTLLKSGGDTRLPSYPDEACTPEALGLMRFDMDTVQVCTDDGWEEVGASVTADDVFAPISGVELSSLQTSNTITFSGYFGTRMASVDNGAVIIVNGAAQGATAQIAAGDTVAIRGNADAVPATLTTFTLRMGAIQRSWNLTTRNPTPAALTIQPTTQNGMDVAGPGSPAYGTTVSFLVRNTGETPTTLSASLLSNAVSFEFSTAGADVGDDCNGKALGLNETCVLDVRPKANDDGSYSGTVTATDGTLTAIASLAGTASGWACTVTAGTTWDVGGNLCEVPTTLNIAHGATAVANDTTDPETGSATYSCSGGVVTVQAGATCNAPPPVQPQCHSVSAGNNMSCAMKADGTVACWGYVGSPTEEFSAVAAGAYHVCGLKPDGTAECWGDNAHGQSTPASGSFVSIFSDGDHSCGLRANGTAVCWGYIGSSGPPPTGTYRSLAMATYHACALKTDDTIACWGRNASGEATAPAGTFKAVVAGSSGSFGHSCGLKSDDTVVCWGDNYFGQSTAPTGTFQQISAGSSHACGLRSDGSAVCWGWNHYGQRNVPAGTYKEISAGGIHTCVVKLDGSVVCVGYNYNGQLNVPVGLIAQCPGGSDDTTPDAFTFADVTGQPKATLIASNSVTITGIDAPTPVSVSGDGDPKIRINDGSWVTSGTITDGQTLEVQLTSSSTNSTARTATVDVGGVTDVWSVTTAAAAGINCSGTIANACRKSGSNPIWSDALDMVDIGPASSFTPAQLIDACEAHCGGFPATRCIQGLKTTAAPLRAFCYCYPSPHSAAGTAGNYILSLDGDGWAQNCN